MPQLNSGREHEVQAEAPAQDTLGKAYLAVTSGPATAIKLVDPTGAASLGSATVEVSEGLRRVMGGQGRESLAPLGHGAVDLVAGIPAVGKLASGAKALAVAAKGAEGARAVAPVSKFFGSVVPTVATALVEKTVSKGPGPDLSSVMRDKIRDVLFKADARSREVREAGDPSPK